MDQIAGAGFEPTTFGLWARRATRLLHPAMIKEDVGFGPTRGQNPPDGFQDRSLQPDLGNPPFIPSFNMVMTRTRFELMLPPWKGGVLTTWPTGHTFLTYLLIIPDLESDVNNFFQKLFLKRCFFLTLRISNNYITKNILTMQPLILIFFTLFLFLSL